MVFAGITTVFIGGIDHIALCGLSTFMGISIHGQRIVIVFLTGTNKEKKKEYSGMNITVYLGANEGNDPTLRKAVEELGAWIGTSGNALIYGGSKSGLMGALADSVLSAGGKVTGVEPQFFIKDEFQHKGLTKLIITKDMSERKNEMINLGDAFIAFPGGTGTLEEITEVMSKVSLKHLNAPCILYNLDGYYNDLKALLKHMIEKGLSSDERQKGIYFAENLDDIKGILSARVI